MTPPNAASLALLDPGPAPRALLIRRAHAPYRDLWTLPGGRIDPGETALAAALRETSEELGLRVPTAVPVLVQTHGTWRIAVFAAPWREAGIVTSPEIADWRWAGLPDLAALHTTPGLDLVLAQAFASLAQDAS